MKISPSRSIQITAAIGLVAVAALVYAGTFEPVITTQPQSQSAKEGESVTFSVTAGNSMNITVPLSSSVSLDMNWCPAGTFNMGSPTGELGKGADESQHQVMLTSGFWMGKYEVTQAQYKAVMGMNPSSYKVNLESETGKYEFVGASADEYPQHRALSDEAVTLEAPAQLLAEGISQTSFAVAPTEDMRPIMGGLYFDATTGNGLNIVATDAHKLARFHMDDITVSEPSAFVMPAKPANVLRTLLGSEGDARISVRFDGNAIYCKTSKYWILTRQIEGKYPAYSAVIPTSNPIEVIVDRAQLLSAVRRVDVCSAGANLTRFKISKGSLLIATQDIDYSLSGQETLPCQYDGDEVEIGFKATLVKEMLGILTSQDVMIQMSDSAHPGLFVPYQKKDGGDVLMLLMPMMLS